MENLTKHELTLREYYIGQMLAGVDAGRDCDGYNDFEQGLAWAERTVERIVQTVDCLLDSNGRLHSFKTWAG